ncbi:uncharacterized protein D12 isoform X4 [Eurosta solidaginis]|uniref:uncharacterized protein D12 isoform X4 n=1 Tax=Eurosta solidaginis TaxID=178769 RepID=UPI003530CA3D
MLRHSCHQLELEDSIPETKPKRNFNMLPAFATQYKQKQHDEYYDPDYTKIPCIDHIYKASDYESITTTIAIVFQREMVIKQEQLENLHKRLDRVRILLDRLRFRIVQNHYREQELLISESDAFTVRGKATPYEEELHGHQKGMHPAIKYLVGKTAKKPSKIIGKSLSVRVPAHNALSTICTWSPKQKREERRLKHVIREPGFVINQSKPKSNQLAPYVGGKAQLYNDDPTVFQLGKHGTIPNTVKKNRLERLSKVLNISRLSNKSKHMIVIGNTSTYIRKENLAGTKKKTSADDIMTHKWLVYVKSRNLDSCLESVIKKVRFNIHPSYRPNDVVDISTPPFQITRRGWEKGEITLKRERINDAQYDSNFMHFTSPFLMRLSTASHNNNRDEKLGQLRDGECKMKIIQEHEGHTHILTGAHVGRIKSPNWLGKKPMHLMPLSTKSVKYITGSFKNIPKKVAYKEGNTNMILKQSLPSHAKINKAELKSNAGDSQKQVFQKEGKLFIIDPLGKKFKQQRRKQKSLLKPQTFWQRQDKQQPHYESAQSKALESMMSDHDYTPAVVIHALNKSTTSIHPSNDAALITSLNVPRQIQISEYNLPYAERSHDFVPFQQRQIQFEKEFLAQNVVGMRFAVDYMLRRLPLIAAKNILASSFSFVSQSLEDFEALPVMKQRACEWLRAKYVTHFVRSHEYLKELNSTNKEVFWSTREVLIYARYHGFTPKLKLFDSFCALQLQTQTSPRSAIYIQTLKPDLRNTTKVQNLQQKLGFAQHFRKRVKLEQGHYHFDSLTPKYRITSWLDTTHHKLKIDKTNLGCDFEKIDIVNMPKNNIREALICKTIDKIDLNPDQPLDSGLLRFLRISENLSEASILVSDFFRDLFIKLEPELVGSNITYPLVHKVIAHCLKVFVEKLISRTVALKKNAPIGDCLDIAMRDIGKVLVRHSEFDFITTQHFGRYEY